MNYYVSFDIGGTSIKYGLIDGYGKIVLKDCLDTEAHLGGKNILAKVEKIVGMLVSKYTILGICISTAGMVDCEKGLIFYSGELIPDYTGTAFRETLEERYHIPCEIENDVNCAGLAEYVSGKAAGSKVAVCLTVGTGIGGCILIDGQIFHGFSNSACEIGYMSMKDSDFQTLGASSILSKKVAARKSSLPCEWDGRRIFEEAKQGDEACREEIQNMAAVLGEGISNICYVVNPEVVVIGGGIAVQEEYLKPLILKEMRKYLKPVICEKTRLEFAAQRNDAGMLGAYYHFRNQRG